MPLPLRAGNFGSQALLGKAPVVEAGQGIKHSQVSQEIGMPLLLGQLAAQPSDKELLVCRE